jgi:hypothetical protein
MVTRRTFLQSAALGAGLTGVVSTATPANAQRQGQGAAGATPKPAAPAPPTPASQLQVPKMKFGNVEISRLILGCNQLMGISHFNSLVNQMMRDWYTIDRVVGVMHQCNKFGINAYNYRHQDRTHAHLQRLESEGGKLHLIVQVVESDVPATIWKDVKPLGMYYLGDTVDRHFQEDNMDVVREWCKKARDTGTMVGVGTHNPEVIDFVESAGWDVDFYAGCVYNRTRTPDEWKKILNGHIQETANETYLQDDPPKMYAAMRKARKPCFAFKVLSAGRVNRTTSNPNQSGTVEQAFRTAYESIKPNDGVFIGMIPYMQDEVRINVEHVVRILSPHCRSAAR